MYAIIPNMQLLYNMRERRKEVGRVREVGRVGGREVGK